MNAEIIAVGSELLLGQIANTNAQFISSELAEAGINVFYHSVVGDNPGRLETVIQNAQTRSNLIIFTGGLGPTKDDLTKETIAAVLGKQLVYDVEAMEGIELYYKRTGRTMTENNRKQALVLEGADVLPNKNGMAPGMALEAGGITYMLLPGPPKEMRPMFRNFGITYLTAKLPGVEPIVSRVLRFFGIGESLLEATLQDIIDEQTNPTVAPLAGSHEVTLRLSAKFKDIHMANIQLDLLEERINERVGEFLYGYGETSLTETTAEYLKSSNLTVSSAESLTGGWFGQQLTELPGSSAFYKGSVVCYSNEMKEKLLDVSPDVLASHGAVSPDTAKQMADNVRKLTGSDIGISFTGVAGPDKSEGKEPGTVFIGLSDKNGTEVFSLSLSGSRASIRERSVKHGLFFLLTKVKKGQ
ncbi:nicotinamide-nucleotide amidase [Fictibacillus enclensis]|uniref:Putative competence-damage inducible protein n=1 Tax=Fictibacillus enclensis TaxID=1017270 RepID=A0A0V8JDB8_9BACL|nr:competence/damage-inducible protein A [Fictibacillus enclensis]KSU85135.1 damage-inducible protein CinA [Fictibacillus enclensis]SCB91512.1 nicotinamide-nucleotide amidase [Fictibacillus enclensis]